MSGSRRMDDEHKINSSCIAVGHLLMTILGLPVGLVMLIICLLIGSIFGCSLCLALVSFVDDALIGGAGGGELLSDLSTSFIIFATSMLIAGILLKIVSSSLKSARGLRKRRIA
jgi:hypothetical protein